jgi:serine/threonine protein kinase
MGSVYLARQAMLGDREVALKQVRFDAFSDEDRDAAMQQFMREAQILAQLKHPNLVDVKDCFEENATVYLVMDYILGQNLEELLAAHPDTPVPYDILQDWMEQLCEVLEYLHNRRPPIIFRDLKPANAMLDGSGVLHLIDFGIARVLEADSMDLAEMQGTPGYAPIEQISVQGMIPDARTDIFALGATLYNLITRQFPGDFEEPDTEAPGYRPLPPSLAQVIGKMMEMRPDNRYRTVAEARAALMKAFAEPMRAAQANRKVSLGEGLMPTRKAEQNEERARRATEQLPPVQSRLPRPTGSLTHSRPGAGQTPTLRRSPRPETNLLPRHVDPATRGGGGPALETHKLNSGAATGRSAERTEPVLSAYIPDLFGRRMDLSFISFVRGRLRFYCPKKPRLAFPLNAFFFDGVRQSEVTLLLLEAQRTEEHIEYEVEVKGLPAYMQPMLTRQVTARDARQELRRLPRTPITFPVTSPELPGEAVARDLSLLGMRLEVAHPIEVGRTVELCLDLKSSMIKVMGEARWCSADPLRGFHVGFKFDALQRESAQALDAFMRQAAGP